MREPDAVQWIDTDHFVIANEGDMDGGSRGFTVFHRDGTEVFEAGTSFEHAIVQIGHYPEDRSGNKGVEAEGMEFGTFGGTPMMFLLAERASVVGVYDMTDPSAPALAQLLPSGISPEGAIAIPGPQPAGHRQRIRRARRWRGAAHVMLYEYQDAPAVYPHLTTEGMDELTGFGAISGQVMAEDGTIYAVSDSFYAMQPTIFHIDPSQTPARIVDAIRVTREGAPAQLAGHGRHRAGWRWRVLGGIRGARESPAPARAVPYRCRWRDRGLRDLARSTAGRRRAGTLSKG